MPEYIKDKGGVELIAYQRTGHKHAFPYGKFVSNCSLSLLYKHIGGGCWTDQFEFRLFLSYCSKRGKGSYTWKYSVC